MPSSGVTDELHPPSTEAGDGVAGPATAAINQEIWDILDSALAAIPVEDSERLPKDGAINHDHYLYGTEKTEPDA